MSDAEDENNVDCSLTFAESDDSDKDPTFEPNPGEEHVYSKEDAEDPEEVRQPGRKKVRREKEWKRFQRQTLRNKGKEYIDRKGNIHMEKRVQLFIHNCRFKCNNIISEEKRQEIFDEFWGLADYNLQSSFLNSSITINDTKRKKEEPVWNRSVSCTYELAGHRVCKEFFLKTFNETPKRIQTVIEKKRKSATGISPKDKRGHNTSGKQIPEASVELVKEHIQSFPRYTSHYSRHQAPDRKYLNTDLNVRKLYALYTKLCREKEIQPVKESFYRHIFNTSFNLSFHKPLTDTCATCDKLQVIIEHGNANDQGKARQDKELHLRKAEAAKKNKDDVREAAKHDASHIAVSFDLQKMLPTPVLSCSKAYYARQLWTYNFCVHNLATSNAYMFMWNESQASRGCQEIASCLLKFIKSLPSNVTHLTAFSDNAGGQNKSRFIVKFWLYVVRNTNIEVVDHKFLISGHSFMECDQNFGLIEKRKKTSDRQIFVPQDWKTVVVKSSKKFMVVRMNKEDFFTLDGLNKFFKGSVTGIRNMQFLQFRKQKPWILFYKPNLSEFTDFTQLNLKSRQSGRDILQLPELIINTEQHKIKYLKYKNLLDLLPYVPPVHHDFYTSLPHHTLEGNRRQVDDQMGIPAEEYADALQLNELDRVYDSDSD